MMVGGKGTRLSSVTGPRPKALVRLGRHSIMEIIISRFRACGFTRATLCVSHLGHMIRSEFGDGRQLGLSIDYSVDEGRLGTAAPLLNVPDWTSPAVVINGDILTTIDFADLLRHHTRSRSLLTVAFQQRQLTAGVGLLRIQDDQVTAVHEKPRFAWNISCGIYVADPLVKRYLPADAPADMPSLITALIQDSEPVNGYRFGGPWHDIGTPERYQRARAEFLADPGRYLDPRHPAAGHDGPLASQDASGLGIVSLGESVDDRSNTESRT